jgi:hypothetical protein
MAKTYGLVVLALLMLAAPVSAQLIADLAFFPVVAHTDGLHGTRWVTDVTVFNPMDYEVEVGLQFHIADEFSTGYNIIYRLPEPLVVGPRETVMIEDALKTLYGFEEDTKGSFLVMARPPHLPNPEGTKILATARIYNTGGTEGTYGQTVPSLIPAVNLGGSSSFITGARNDSAFRSNLGIVCMADPVRVHYRIFVSDHTVVAEGFKDLKYLTTHQWSFEQLGVGNVEGPVTVELWLDPDDALDDPCSIEFPDAFLAYASKVDNLTGDAEFLLAIPMTPDNCEGHY